MRWVWAFSTLLVLSFVAVVAPSTEGSVVRFISKTGLLLLAPIAIFSVLALSIAPFLRSVASATFIALNIASIGALIWAWSVAPYGEDGFVFGVYLAAALLILVVSFAFAALLARRGRL